VGLAFGLHWLFFFLSIKLANAAVGAIGFSTYGIHLLVLGWMLGMGTVTLVDLAGMALAFGGTLLLVPEFSFQNEHTLGLIAGVASGLAAAVLPLLHQRYADVPNGLRTWGQFTFALPVFLVFWPWTDWRLGAADVALALYLGLGIALVGHGLWIQATTVLSTTTTSILSYLYLPGSLVFSYFAIGERLSGRMLAGTACVLVANALVLWRQTKLRALEANVPETT
jgi:drug/metabolite transporter (DMT)-like permease